MAVDAVEATRSDEKRRLLAVLQDFELDKYIPKDASVPEREMKDNRTEERNWSTKEMARRNARIKLAIASADAEMIAISGDQQQQHCNMEQSRFNRITAD